MLLGVSSNFALLCSGSCCSACCHVQCTAWLAGFYEHTQAGPDCKPGQTSLASWCRRAALRLKILSTPGTRMLTDMGMTDGGVGHLPGERTQVRAMQGLAKRCARPDHVGNLLLGNRRASYSPQCAVQGLARQPHAHALTRHQQVMPRLPCLAFHAPCNDCLRQGSAKLFFGVLLLLHHVAACILLPAAAQDMYAAFTRFRQRHCQDRGLHRGLREAVAATSSMLASSQAPQTPASSSQQVRLSVACFAQMQHRETWSLRMAVRWSAARVASLPWVRHPLPTSGADGSHQTASTGGVRADSGRLLCAG